MARGRKSQGAGDVLSIRIPDQVRRDLQAAAEKSGVTLNQEIRTRLSRSFETDRSVVEKYGDRRTAAFFRMLSITVASLDKYGEVRRKFWLDDRYQYIQVATAIKALLGAFEPTGPIRPKGAVAPEMVGLVGAGHVLAGVLFAGKKLSGWWPKELDHAIEPPAYSDANIHADLKDYFDRVPSDLSQSPMFRREFEKHPWVTRKGKKQ